MTEDRKALMGSLLQIAASTASPIIMLYVFFLGHYLDFHQGWGSFPMAYDSTLWAIKFIASSGQLN